MSCVSCKTELTYDDEYTNCAGECEECGKEICEDCLPERDEDDDECPILCPKCVKKVARRLAKLSAKKI